MSQCQSEVRLTPRALPWQTLIESRIERRRRRRRSSGTRTTSATRSPPSRSSSATTASRSWRRASSTCEPRDGVPRHAAVGGRARRAARARQRRALEAFEFVFDSPLVPPAPSSPTSRAELSRRAGRCSTALDDLSHRIHADFRYDADGDDASTRRSLDVLARPARRLPGLRPSDDWRLRSLRPGGALRLRLPAERRQGTQGADASHAWVSVFCRARLDRPRPTNDVRPATPLTLAWGRDYGDVAPVKGVALGGGHQVVEVEVRVEPV